MIVLMTRAFGVMEGAVVALSLAIVFLHARSAAIVTPFYALYFVTGFAIIVREWRLGRLNSTLGEIYRSARTGTRFNRGPLETCAVFCGFAAWCVLTYL
jgi:hypothetical protein